MWKEATAALLPLMMLSCASAPRAPSAWMQWSDYEGQLMQQREAGKLSPVAAEDAAEHKYQELFGRDPEMEGAFAYGADLYAAAQVGVLSTAEADALTQARVDEIMQRRRSQVDYHEWLTAQFPPLDIYK